MSSVSSRTILDLNAITFSYDYHKEFIHHLSFSLKEGEFIGLLGANGSGKSTILKLACGILTPFSGLVSVWERPLQSFKNRDRAKLQCYLPQFLDIQIPFRVRDLVRMGLYPYDILPAATIEQVLETVGLSDKADCLITNLSGGEQRRAFIAMALLQGAGILLLDEPLSALDLQLRQRMLLELDRIHDEVGITFLYITHEQTDAMSVSDRIAVLHKGKVEQIGTPVELYESPKRSFVAAYGAQLARAAVAAHQRARTRRDHRQDAIAHERRVPACEVLGGVRGEWPQSKAEVFVDIERAGLVLLVERRILRFVLLARQHPAVDQELAPLVVAVAREQGMVQIEQAQRHDAASSSERRSSRTSGSVTARRCSSEVRSMCSSSAVSERRSRRTWVLQEVPHHLVGQLQAAALRLGMQGERLLGVAERLYVVDQPPGESQGWAAAIVDAPSDRAEGMSDAFRRSPDHVKDIRAVMDFLDKQGLGPIYLAGTSRGTLSAAYVAAMLSDPRLKGLVLMSTVGEDLSAALLQKITVPVLLVHHRDDGCMKAPFQAAVRLKGFFTRSPRVDFIEVQGGLQSESDPCLPMSYHGFLGKEKEVVKAVIDWLAGKGAPGRIGP